MNCENLSSNFCTAAKCQELEARIGALEQALELLQAAFEAHIAQPIPEAHDYTPPDEQNEPTSTPLSNLSISASFESDTLTLTVADGESFATAQVEIPVTSPTTQTESDPHIPSNLRLDGSFFADTLTLTVADGESSDTTQINIPLPDIPESTEQHVRSNLVGSASFRNDVLTISIADGESQDTFSVFIPTNESPQTIFVTEEIYMNCEELERKIDDCCQQIINELGNVENNLTNQIDSAQNIITGDIQTVENYVTVDISGEINSNYQCIENTDTQQLESKFTPINYTGIGLSGIHEKLKLMSTNLDAIFKPLCELENETETVVSIVASPKYVTNIEGKVLVLHFVTLDNYPKRSAGSYPRPIQIPGARENYDWINDFYNLRWITGNQYGELELEGYVAKVSGWFRDKEAGNSYFDAVLNLTTGTQKNRNFPDRSNPRTDIAVVETRPYRAFIESVDAGGNAICHAKYVPVEP